jgi:6-phosphogluconolactonase
VRALALACALVGCAEQPFVPDFSAEGQDASELDLTRPPEEMGDGAPPLSQVVYVGGYSSQIERFRFQPSTGALTSLGVTPVSGNPSFLAVDAARRHLYAVDESMNGLVRAFSIDGATGDLAPLGAAVSSGGQGPAHLSLHPSGKWLLVANYTDGKVAVIVLNSDGSLGVQSDNKLAGQNAHQILADESGAHVFVPCLGSDYVAQYLFNSGQLVPNGPATVAVAMGAGPRHLALAPGFAWLISEKNSTMIAYTRDSGGRLTFLQSLPTVPTGVMNNTAAEVVVNNNHLYGSNRGDDSLVEFSLSGGNMSTVGYTKSGGKTPRSFTIDPSGRWLLVANQDSNEVRVFSLDAASGVPTMTSVQVTAPKPSFVGVVTLPGS